MRPGERNREKFSMNRPESRQPPLHGQRVTCPDCGFQGVIESHGADDVLGGLPGEEGVFRLTGRDCQDNMLLVCPKCRAENSFHLSAGFLMRVSTLLLAALGLALASFLVRQLIAWLAG